MPHPRAVEVDFAVHRGLRGAWQREEVTLAPGAGVPAPPEKEQVQSKAISPEGVSRGRQPPSDGATTGLASSAGGRLHAFPSSWRIARELLSSSRSQKKW